MQKQFEKYLAERCKVLPAQNLLVAFSGGLDSTALAFLLSQTAYKFALAHCNFALRPEADFDANHCAEIAKQLGVPFFEVKFDTQAHMALHKIGVQEAARNLRYDWFAKIMKDDQYDALLTAHHEDDVAETFVHNLVRGTGLRGLAGMQPRSFFNDGFVRCRPLLWARKKTLSAHLNDQLTWVEDSSNDSQKYTRNKIRHTILPQLSGINSSAIPHIATAADLLLETEILLADKMQSLKAEVTTESNNQLQIDIDKLAATLAPRSLLFYILEPFGFSSGQVHEVEALFAAQSGKMVHTEAFTVAKDRAFLLVYPKQNATLVSPNTTQIHADTDVLDNPLNLLCKTHEAAGYRIDTRTTVGAFDLGKLQFPLSLRKWENGDRFSPLGMAGKQTKLSDFLVQQKVTLTAKKDVFVLCSGGKIVWVVGYRISEEFKITEASKQVFEIKLI